MGVKENVGLLLTKIGMSGVRRVTHRKPSLIKEILDDPEKFKLEAFIENEEIVVKIKRKDIL